MIFSLEALQANEGDSLILHFGKKESPRFIVIDGGPAKVYEGSLKPRLEELHSRWKRDDDGKLDVEMLMVSHIDKDHIQGVLDWLKDLEEAEELEYNILTLWHNSFDDVAGNSADELRSKLKPAMTAALASNEASGGLEPGSAAVLASVAQGRDLRAVAKKLGIPLNSGFKGLVSALPDGKSVVKMGAGLTLRVIGPSMERLEKLAAEWDAFVRKPGKAEPAALASYADRTATNLSSIVVLAEADGKRMLLTGDARGDYVLEGLEGAGLMEDGRIHVDVFKVPHHGSSRNTTLDFFERITADHYVISASGKDGNPDPDVIKWISQARGEDEYTIHLTNKKLYDARKDVDVAAAIRKVLQQNPAPRRTIGYPESEGQPVRVDLGDEVDY